MSRLAMMLVAAVELLSACAVAPPSPRYDTTKSLGPCTFGFETEADTWYVLPDRDPIDSGYARGAFVAVMAAFISVKGASEAQEVRVVAGPTDRRVAIPSYSQITGGAKESCEAFAPVTSEPVSQQ